MNEEFMQFLAHTGSIGALNEFLSDFLTPSEQIMFAKRLMIAILIKRGHIAEKIKFRLNVSNSAILGVQSWLKFPHPKTILALNDHNSKQNIRSVIDKIEEIFDLLPPGKYTNWQAAGKAKFARLKTRNLKSQLR